MNSTYQLKSKKVFFNYLFLQKVKLLAHDNIAFKQQDYLIHGLWIIFYELLNHRDIELREYVNSLEEKNGFVRIDIDFVSIFSCIGTKFKTSVSRLFNNYKLKDYINLAHSDVMYIEEDGFYINIKVFLLRFKNKNNQYLPIHNNEFINNMFKYINKFNGKKTQDILYCLSLGLLVNLSKAKEFSIVQITKQKDYNITRLKRLQNQYLELLVIVKAIDSYYYNVRKNSYIININADGISVFNKKTFIKQYVKDIFKQIRFYKLDYLKLFNLFKIPLNQKHILNPQ
ncbi:hypothetical protein HAV_00179 [Candidatus Hepatincola sp. Av]